MDTVQHSSNNVDLNSTLKEIHMSKLECTASMNKSSGACVPCQENGKKDRKVIYSRCLAILTHFEVIQVSIQLLVIFGHGIFPVVLEVVGQTIIKEHGPLLKKT